MAAFPRSCDYSFLRIQHAVSLNRSSPLSLKTPPLRDFNTNKRVPETLKKAMQTSEYKATNIFSN